MKINFKLLSIAVIGTCLPLLAESTCVSSKTFFMPRSIGSDATLQYACDHNFTYRHEPADCFFLHSAVFYQSSMNSSDLRHYFFPAGKNELTIKGALAEGERDISATWLQISGKNTNRAAQNVPIELGFTNGLIDGNTTRGDIELYLNEFSSKITICPTYQMFGTQVQVYHNLDWLAKRLWCSFYMPFVQMETKTNFCEKDIQNADSSRGDIAPFKIDNSINAAVDITRLERASLYHQLNAREAFNNPLWRYGKLHDCVQKLAGIADVQCKLGYNFIRSKSFRFNTYAHVSIPTGYKPTAEFAFEPIIGNAGHWGIGVGTGIDMTLINGKSCNVSLNTNLDYLYLLNSRERRSMDLIGNGDWSRYLLVVDTQRESNSNARTLLPGINLFTRKVDVKPNHDVNMVASLRLGCYQFFIEGGYNFWFKSAEEIKLCERLPEGLAIAATHYGARDAANPFEIRTFSQATIASHIASPSLTVNIPADATHTDDDPNRPVLLTSSQLNLCSAAHPQRTSHKLFISTGLHGDWEENPVQVALGGSYEFAEKNRSLDQWAIFIKLNLSI